MHLSLFFVSLDMLIVLALSTAAVGHFQVSQQQSIIDTYTRIHIHDTTGPITVNLYSSPLPVSSSGKLSDAQLEVPTVFNVVVGTLVFCLAICAIVHWPSNCIASPVQTKSGPPAGRRSEVPDWPEFKVDSPTRM